MVVRVAVGSPSTIVLRLLRAGPILPRVADRRAVGRAGRRWRGVQAVLSSGLCPSVQDISTTRVPGVNEHRPTRLPSLRLGTPGGIVPDNACGATHRVGVHVEMKREGRIRVNIGIGR